MATIIILAVVILGIVGLDQLTKWLVVEHLPLGSSYEWLRGVVHFTYVQNEGAAFSILQNHRWVFLVFSTVAIVGLSVYLFRFCKQNRAVKISIAFLIGGGIGNMIDRIALGYVVDFIEWPWLWLPILKMPFPIFNVADSFITVGVVILSIALIRDAVCDEKEKKKQAAAGEQEAPEPEEQSLPEPEEQPSPATDAAPEGEPKDDHE